MKVLLAKKKKKKTKRLEFKNPYLLYQSIIYGLKQILFMIYIIKWHWICPGSFML